MPGRLARFERSWSILPELPKEEKKPGKVGLWVEIVLGVIGIMFFSYIRSTGGKVPYFINPDAVLQMVPLFTGNFLRFMPYMIALAGLDIARNATTLVQGYHSAFTSWWQIATRAANIVLLAFLIGAMPLISLESFGELAGAEGFAQLGRLANTGLAIGLGLGLFGTLVEIVRSIIHEVRNPSM